jgi:hypothetical protein
MKVLLIPGMGRTPVSLWRLRRFLRREGHEATVAGYSATFERFEAIVARVRRHLEALAATGMPYAVVAHSLGGILTRAALPGVTPKPARLVFLGTPFRAPRLAVRLASRWPYRLVNGECGQRLADDAFLAALPLPDVPLTAIAGTRGPRGRWSPFGSDPNDGIVAVGEAACDGVEAVHLPATHTFLMNHPEARAVIRRALS